MTADKHMGRRELLLAGAGAGLAVTVGTAATTAGQAAAQPVPTLNRPTITLAAATAMLTAAEAKARELGVPMTMIVVDESGQLKAAARMDGNAFGSIEIVMRKAVTSAGFRAPTHVLGERAQTDPARLASFANLPNIWLGGGGLPISRDGVVIGAIAAGGGSPEQDIEVAQAGIAALG